MGYHDHHETCYLSENHPLCRLRKIHELQVKVQTLETQLQYERTGHLTEYPPLYADHFGMPCSDVDPPKIATHSVVLPTDARFTHHGEEPPSATP